MKLLGKIIAMTIIGACLLAIWYFVTVIVGFLAIVGTLWVYTL